MTACVAELCLNQNQAIAAFFALMVPSNVRPCSSKILIAAPNKAVQSTASPKVAPPTGARDMQGKARNAVPNLTTS